MKNFLSLLVCGVLLVTVFMVALHSIDNITKRDCDRGIKDACKYINN